MRNRIAMSVAVVLSACTPSPPAPVSNAAPHHPDLSGFWELAGDSKQVPAAELTPLGKEETAKTWGAPDFKDQFSGKALVSQNWDYRTLGEYAPDSDRADGGIGVVGI